MDKFFTLEVDSKYSETKTSGDWYYGEQISYVVLPNGTMIVKDPKLTKYLMEHISDVSQEYEPLGGGRFVLSSRRPWESIGKCIDYEEDILRKRSEEKTDGEETVIPLTGEAAKKLTQLIKERLDEPERESSPNLLEIKLKDTDSVPEVYYKGERMDEAPKGLVDIAYHWHTEEADYQVPRGANDISIEYYDAPNDKYLDRKIIGHKRDM